MAMPTLCFMPPLSSWAKARSTSRLSPTDFRSSSTLIPNSFLERPDSWVFIPSTICSFTRITGFREFMVPWVTRETRARRTLRISSSERLNRSVPSRRDFPRLNAARGLYEAKEGQAHG